MTISLQITLNDDVETAYFSYCRSHGVTDFLGEFTASVESDLRQALQSSMPDMELDFTENLLIDASDGEPRNETDMGNSLAYDMLDLAKNIRSFALTPNNCDGYSDGDDVVFDSGFGRAIFDISPVEIEEEEED